MKVSYYPGCTLHGTAREYAELTDGIARTLGIELQELPDWNCCGATSAHVSDNTLAVALPARNLAIADKIGQKLVVPCAACFNRLKNAEVELLAGEAIEGIDGKYSGKVNIKHITDFIWDDVGEKAIAAKVKKSLAALHPVCYYGCLIVRPPRITGAKNYEDPQSMDNIMTTLGAEVKPWSYKTDCCGAGHVLTRPDVAHKLIQKLLDMAVEAGADCMVTGCPMCQENLDGPQKELSHETGKKYDFPVFLFTELMGLAFGDPGVEKWLGRHAIDPRPFLKQKGLL